MDPLEPFKEFYRETLTAPEDMSEPHRGRMQKCLNVVKVAGALLLADFVSLSVDAVLSLTGHEADTVPIGHVQTAVFGGALALALVGTVGAGCNEGLAKLTKRNS
jgi:hypothetical protein